MSLPTVVQLLSVMRVLLGLAPILAAGLTSSLLGFPAEHDNPTTRLMARLFGVRDIGLGVLGFAAVWGTLPYGFVLLFNAATDLGDACVIAVPLVGRHGIDRAARLSLLLACLGGLSWLLTWLLLT